MGGGGGGGVIMKIIQELLAKPHSPTIQTSVPKVFFYTPNIQPTDLEWRNKSICYC